MVRELTTCLACHPSMKLDKSVVQRRLDLMAAEGVVRYLLLLGHRASIETDLLIFIDFRAKRQRWR